MRRHKLCFHAALAVKMPVFFGGGWAMFNRRWSADRRAKRCGGFTLIEMMMVVAALAIMAGVVVPQVSTALDDAKQSTMLFNLREVGAAIERYRVDHDGTPPELVLARGLPQLTGKTNASGDIGTGAEYVYGPYIDRLPENPLNGTANVYRVNTVPPADLEKRVGWVYHQPTGQIWAGLYSGPVPPLSGGLGSGGPLSEG
jgi:prepilin-type N-terminal cleavage/methylation domain-containing protein